MAPTGAAEIVFDHVTKRYPGREEAAVEDLSLTIPAGDICILVGPSGAGKTTAMKMVNRLIEYDEGDIRIDGTSIRDQDVTQLRRRIGYVIQHVGLFPHMTIADNIAPVPRLRGWERAPPHTRVGYLREHKSPDDVAFMRAAIDITERAIGLALAEAREGMREDELEGVIVSHIAKLGARGDGLVQFGPRSAVPHNQAGDRRLAAGDVILIDFGAQVNGYWSDISRPAVFGKATGRMKLVHETIRQAQDVALERARPGMPCESLDQVARAMIGGKGFFKFLLHRLGHGIGLDGHEPPWLTIGNSVKLALGNVATLEPGIYTPGEYGIRIEDMMEVTEQGGRLLSHPPSAILEL